MTSSSDLRLFKIDQYSLDMASVYTHNIRQKIKGRLAIEDHTAGVLHHVISECTGDHLEIGTMHGGSAIFAALCIEDSTRRVITIDQFCGDDDKPISVAGVPVNLETAHENFKTFGVKERIKVIETKSQHLDYRGLSFDTAFIDGGHTKEAVRNDWWLANAIVKNYIIFDDVCEKYPGVVAAFQYACVSSDWVPVYLSGIVGVLRRKQ